LGLLQVGVLPIKVVSTGVRHVGRIVSDAIEPDERPEGPT